MRWTSVISIAFPRVEKPRLWDAVRKNWGVYCRIVTMQARQACRFSLWKATLQPANY